MNQGHLLFAAPSLELLFAGNRFKCRGINLEINQAIQVVAKAEFRGAIDRMFPKSAGKVVGNADIDDVGGVRQDVDIEVVHRLLIMNTRLILRQAQDDGLGRSREKETGIFNDSK